MFSLKNVMRSNATSCLVFGGLFTLQSVQVASFLGGESPAPQSYVLSLGILLILNGLHLLWASRTPLPSKKLILYFSAGDYLWVVATLGLIFSGIWITTKGGVLIASAVGIMVGLFGVLQMTSRKSMGYCDI